MKKYIDIVGKKIGKMIEFLIQHPFLFALYNTVFENASFKMVRVFVRYINLPKKENIWTITLKNHKKVKTNIYPENIKTLQFALSYKWHSPSLNFTEYILNRHAAKERPWIDIGANLGLRSLLALSEHRKVFMIEPNKELNQLNAERCALNNFSNYQIIELGVSDKKATAEFYIDESSYNSSLDSGILTHNVLERKETIQLDSIDNLFSTLEHSPACIKIDVEGHEIQVLEGGRNFIAKWMPPMIIEVNMTGNNLGAFKELIKEFGYSLYQIKRYSSTKFYKKIDLENNNTRIDSNDFLAIKDAELEKVIHTYTVFN